MKEFQKLSETEMELMEVIWKLDHSVKSSELLTIFSQSKGKLKEVGLFGGQVHYIS